MSEEFFGLVERTRNDMNADEFADAPGSDGTRFGSGFNRTNIATHEDRPRCGVQRGHRAHRGRQRDRGGVVLVTDVRIAELREQEGLGSHHAVVVSGRWRPTWPT